jgi:adenylate cyclase
MEEDVLPVGELLDLGEPIYSANEIVEVTGVDVELADRLWLAMGFAMLPRDEKAFTEADRAALEGVAAFEKGGFASRELILAITRVLSQSMARVADAEVGAIRAWINDNVGEDQDALAAARQIAPQVVEYLETFLVHVWRRHVHFAIERQGLLGASTDERILTVGFADLVGFTQMSRHLDEPGLANVVERLESRSQELISDLGGRVVKSLGDEVMFAAEEAGTAAEIGLGLVDESLEDDELPELRVGLATGPVVSHRGDLFGSTVNLASRAVDAAHPASVLVSSEVKDELKDDERFLMKAIAPRRLKGIGTTRLWVLRRGPASLDA